MTRWLLLLALVASSAWAQDRDVEDRLDQLEEQNRKILDRLESSESENAALKDEVERLHRERNAMLGQEIEDYLNSTATAQGGDAGLTTKGGHWWELYGFLRFDIYYNTARMNSPILPATVNAEGGAQGRDDNQIAFDVRLTRVGFNFKFGQVGNASVTGKLETDFANFPSGSAESRETPRIRLAYIDLDFGTWTVRLGQDWDVISPLYPSVNHELVMWNAGNLGDRRPQAQALWSPEGKPYKAEFSIGFTGAVSAVDLDSNTEPDGWDSGVPGLQGRFVYAFDAAEIGVWGHAAFMDADTPVGGEDEWTPWAIGLDHKVPIGNRLVVTGELWIGQALADMRGNIGMSVNPATGQEIGGWGGWIELQFRHSDAYLFYVGFSTDDPSNSDVPAGSAILNRIGYAGVKRNWSKDLVSVFDILYWETDYGASGLGNALRFNFWTAFYF